MVDDTDTKFRHYTKREVFDLNFSPQNIMLTSDNQVHYIPGPVSPPRMDLSFEEDIPVAFSPITDQENDSTDQEDGEHFEPNLLNYTNNLSSQSHEYVEPDLPENLLIYTHNKVNYLNVTAKLIVC